MKRFANIELKMAGTIAAPSWPIELLALKNNIVKENEVEEKHHCKELRFFTNKRRFFATFGYCACNLNVV